MKSGLWRTGFLVALVGVLLAGCATTPRIDWAARVGHYTYDQAVTELGPPGKSARLSDGSRVAEWLERPAEVFVTPDPYFIGPGGCWAPFPPSYSVTRQPARYLRLTFGPDGKLTQVQRLVR
jgi:hypothetical protein